MDDRQDPVLDLNLLRLNFCSHLQPSSLDRKFGTNVVSNANPSHFPASNWGNLC